MLRRTWQQAEKRVAKISQGKTRPGSGAPWDAKGDVKSITHLIQVKATTRKSYVVSLEELRILGNQAVMQDRAPMLVIQFQTENGWEKWSVQPYYDNPGNNP